MSYPTVTPTGVPFKIYDVDSTSHTSSSLDKNSVNSSVFSPVTSTGLPYTESTILNTESTLTPCDQKVVNKGLFSQIKAYVSSVLESIRKCLTGIPLVGRFFMTETELDVDILAQIFKGYKVREATAETIDIIPLTVNDAAPVFHLFCQLRIPTSKMKVFCSILHADNTTNEIAMQFYTNLPVDMQNEFRRQIRELTEFPIVRSEDTGFSIDERTSEALKNEIRSDTARKAAMQYLLQLCATTTAITS